MIDRTRCMARRDSEPLDTSALTPVDRFLFRLRSLGGPRCQEPATHESVVGRRCARHAEELRRSLRDPHTVVNVLAGGRARTEEEIARMVVELPS